MSKRSVVAPEDPSPRGPNVLAITLRIDYNFDQDEGP